MITQEQARALFGSSDLIGIGLQADAVRKQLHPEQVVSYAVDGGDEAIASDAIGTAVLEVAAASTVDQRIDQILELRRQQEATHCFISFTVTATGHPEITASEYMKMLAISRIYLDN